jgi:transcriptional regulator with XRE-family HTH domain
MAVMNALSELSLLARTRELAASGEARRLRVAARISQAEVAALCGVQASAVSRWESGERVPRGRAARRYGEVLSVLRAEVSP